MQMHGSMTGANSQPANTAHSSSSMQSALATSQAAGLAEHLVSIVNDPLFTAPLAPTTSSVVRTTSPETSPEAVPTATTTLGKVDSDIPIDLISEPMLGPGGWDLKNNSCLVCLNDLSHTSDGCMLEELKSCRIMLCKTNAHCQHCGVNCDTLYG